MAQILVTGANGFIGSHLIETLLERGHDVIGVIRKNSDLRSIYPLMDRYGDRLNLVVWDLRDREKMESVLRRVQYVYHLGAQLTADSTKAYVDANVMGSRNLLEAISNARPPAFRRFLFVSAQAAAGPSPNRAPIDESCSLHPISRYGKSKAEAEVVVERYGRDVPATIVRPALVYGEGEKAISELAFPIVKAGLTPWQGLFPQKASLIYVQDAVDGMIEAAENPLTVGKTYFLSNPRPYSRREVVRAISKAMGKRVLLPAFVSHVILTSLTLIANWKQRFKNRRALPARNKMREFQQLWWTVSPAAAKHDFGWSATVSLQEGMQHAVDDWLRRGGRSIAR